MTTPKTEFYPVKIVILMIVSLNIWACSKNEQSDDQINIGFSTQIKSEIFDEEREILIHLPVGYYDSEESFPVMVMTDGRYHFNHVSTMSDLLQKAKHSPGLIIIGVDNSTRGRDYTPLVVSDSTNTGLGGADKFLQYIEEEVIPYIETNYRTSSYRLLAGWSLGGLFTFHTMMNRPELFDAYISLSPSLGLDEKRQVGEVIKYLDDKKPINISLFMTMANETGAMLEGIEEIADYLINNEREGLRWDYKHYPNETHYSGTFRGMFDGLEFVFRSITELQSRNNIANLVENVGFEVLDTQFDELSELYGRRLTLDLSALENVGYWYLDEGKTDLAIMVFKDYTKRSPEDPFSWGSLGEGYLAAGLFREAVSSFEQAISLARKNENPHQGLLEYDLKRAKLELEKHTTN